MKCIMIVAMVATIGCWGGGGAIGGGGGGSSGSGGGGSSGGSGDGEGGGSGSGEGGGGGGLGSGSSPGATGYVLMGYPQPGMVLQINSRDWTDLGGWIFMGNSLHTSEFGIASGTGSGVAAGGITRVAVLTPNTVVPECDTKVVVSEEGNSAHVEVVECLDPEPPWSYDELGTLCAETDGDCIVSGPQAIPALPGGFKFALAFGLVTAYAMWIRRREG